MTEPATSMRIGDCQLSFQFRSGALAGDRTGDALIIVPGIGCSKRWSDSVFRSTALHHTAVCTFDLPGQGDLAAVEVAARLSGGDVGFLTRWVRSIYELTSHTADRFHLVTHSMGNIPGLGAWQSIPEHQRGAFIAIEGNLSDADCFASSQMARSTADTEAFIDRLRTSPDTATRLWGDEMLDCDPEYLYGLAASTVRACQGPSLAEQWASLEHPHYLYGDRSGYPEHHRDLFERTGTTVVAIPGSGHFPMFNNREATWDAVADAVRSTRGH